MKALFTPASARWIRGGLLALFLLGVVLLPLLASPFTLRLANVIGMFALVVMGLVLLTGYAGLASLGQAAFMGMGAYTVAVLEARYGSPALLNLVAAGAVAIGTWEVFKRLRQARFQLPLIPLMVGGQAIVWSGFVGEALGAFAAIDHKAKLVMLNDK